MRATVRAHSRDVSTSSAATIQSGAFLARRGPGEDGEPARCGRRGTRLAAAVPALGAEAASRGRLGLHADLRQQASQQGDVQPGPFGRRRTDRHPEVAGQPLQLPLKVLPLADPQVVQEVGAAHAAEGRGGQLALPLGQVLPQVQVGDEVRVRVGEPAVLVVGRLLRVGGPLARILDGQRRRDDQHLADAAVPVGLEDHPADARVHRQPGQLAPQTGDAAILERVQLGEQGRARRRCCARRAGR